MAGWKLQFKSVDDDPEEKDFDSIEEAIAFAKEWFLSGYGADNDTINDDARKMALEDVPKLEDSLKNGKEFYCGLFYERISLHQRS